MNKLGTHNSLSYLPCQWWLRLFSWIGRCQSLNIEEQYDRGVRWFDIRIKYKEDRIVSGHGLLTYNADIDAVFTFLNSKKDCIVRLFLENSKKNPEKHFDRFEKDIESWKEQYPDIRFVEGGCRYQYRQFIADKEKTRDCYWEKDFGLSLPCWWAKRHNYQLHHGDNETEYSVYDFIEY